VLAFEGNPRNYELLVKNIDVNQLADTISPVRAVVSDGAHSSTMGLPEFGNTGMYYFLPGEEGSTTSDKAITIDDQLAADGVRAKIKLLKIDSEGSELRVLKGAARTIEKDWPIVYLEVNDPALERFNVKAEDIERLLRTWDYDFYMNTGERNSSNDAFTISPISHLREGGWFFDLLALPRRKPSKKWLKWFT
jgi:FkbM family methyltransferase